MSQDILIHLSNTIRNSILTDQHFTNESSIRGSVYRFFLENYENHLQITGDKILHQVAFGSELTSSQQIKLDRIINAWREWDYILGQFKNPHAPQ